MEELVHNLNIEEGMNKKIAAGVVVLIIAGMTTGYFLAQKKTGGAFSLSKSSSIIKSKKIVGSKDKVFKDNAEGVLEKGGIDGEGSHKLIREGGPSQTVYLTSSVINLDEFVGSKVKVWGETFAAEKAGWLMDVGRLQVLE